MSSFFNTLQNIPALLAAKLTVFFCGFLLLFALALEHFIELTPCPLCIAQRFFFLLIGLTAFVFWQWPKFITQKLVGVKIVAFALLGGIIAIRQVWMQWHPQNLDPTRCGVSFGSFIDQFLLALGGTGDCATVDWTLIGLSIAEWSALSFIVLFFVGVWFIVTASQREVISEL